MHDQDEFQRQQLLTMIEAAQRAGRSEREIVAIVERHVGRGTARVEGVEGKVGRLRRLIGRGAVGEAA